MSGDAGARASDAELLAMCDRVISSRFHSGLQGVDADVIARALKLRLATGGVEGAAIEAENWEDFEMVRALKASPIPAPGGAVTREEPKCACGGKFKSVPAKCDFTRSDLTTTVIVCAKCGKGPPIKLTDSDYHGDKALHAAGIDISPSIDAAAPSLVWHGKEQCEFGHMYIATSHHKHFGWRKPAVVLFDPEGMLWWPHAGSLPTHFRELPPMPDEPAAPAQTTGRE